MQTAENARCEKHDLAAGVGQGWIYVRVGGAKNPPVFRAGYYMTAAAGGEQGAVARRGISVYLYIRISKRGIRQ